MNARSWSARRRRLVLAISLCLLLGAAGAERKDAGQLDADKQALTPLQVYVGGWKGVGQLRRQSTEGAWTEAADWAWKFDDGRAAFVFQSPQSKYYVSGRLLAGEKPGSFEMRAVRTDRKTEDRFVGGVDDKDQLVLVAQRNEAPAAGAATPPNLPDRISIRTVADGDRLLILYERKIGGADRYTRLAEVGYTRQGSSFAKGSSQPECVVTGGLGTIEVQYQGKKYLVCCTGCRDLFNDDPEGVLADYRERKAQEKAEQEAKK